MNSRSVSTLPCVFLLLFGCQGALGTVGVDEGDPDAGHFRNDDDPVVPTSCPSDPDCAIGGDCTLYECPDYWVCENIPAGKRCVNPGPDLPDQAGGWMCEDRGGQTRCSRPGADLPDNSGGGEWDCVVDDNNEFVRCTDSTPNYPDGDGGGGYDCFYIGGDEVRVCESRGEGGGGGWACVDTDEGGRECRNSGPGFPDERRWECWDLGGSTYCRVTGSDLPDGAGGGDWVCARQGEFVICRDDSPEYPDSPGEWMCRFDDEDRVCVEEGELPDGGGDTVWRCTITDEFETCTDEAPGPDGRDWDCVELAGLLSCSGSGELPDGRGGDGWHCERSGDLVNCADRDPEFPDRGGDTPWSCRVEADTRVCSREREVPDTGGGGSWTCETTEEFERCIDEDPEFPDGRGGWECVENEWGAECTTPSGGLPDGGAGGGWTCTETEWGEVTCRDDSPEYPDGGGGGGWNCRYEGGRRICERGDEGGGFGICEPGVVRWCDDDVFCSWGKQTCLPDGTWGRCVEPVVESGALTDRPDTACGCRHFFFDYDCCEDQEDRDGDGIADCIIPPLHEPPACDTDGTICSFCDTSSQCGEGTPTDDWDCVWFGFGVTMCSHRCDTDDDCEAGYFCDYSGFCEPSDGSCDD